MTSKHAITLIIISIDNGVSAPDICVAQDCGIEAIVHGWSIIPTLIVNKGTRLDNGHSAVFNLNSTPLMVYGSNGMAR